MTVPTAEPLDAFESRLLAELRRVVADQAATGSPAPVDRNAGRPPRRRWVTIGAAAAVATAGLVVWTASSGGNPAYAVEENSAGDVSFSLFSPEGTSELESALADHGITADITVLPANTMCASGRFPGERDWPHWLPLPDIGRGDTTQRIPAGSLEDGQTLVVVYMGTLDARQPGATSATSLAIADGPVGECVPINVPMSPSGE